MKSCIKLALSVEALAMWSYYMFIRLVPLLIKDTKSKLFILLFAVIRLKRQKVNNEQKLRIYSSPRHNANAML
jgi:hypothetical protein